MFSPGDSLSSLVDPFLLLDYHAPYTYEPTATPRGVGVHPHRGFETVTLAFEGSVAHHDSTGAGGVIGPGDVQWMTAASGILHKEYHEAEWARHGGRFQMVQLWVNLPADHKMDAPRYQPVTADAMRRVELPEQAGVAKLIAGDLGGERGPASTFTPINLWDVQLRPGARFVPDIPSGHNAALLVIDGEAVVNEAEAASGRLVILGHSEESRTAVELATASGARVLIMTGEPIGESIATYGPFVMNTRQQLIDAFDDFQAGKFGHLAD
jgi:hypothetical protein